LRGADGQFRPFLTRVMPLHESEGRILQWFGTNTEITEQKAMEEALREAKAGAERANRAKTKFLAAASHDLRQPVQSLVLLLSVAERQVAGQPKTVETIKTMKAALDGLNGLLTATLDISRLDAGVVAPVMESVDLGALVRRLDVEYTPKASNKGLGFRAAQQGARVRTDPALLERALRNLIENAMRYTLKGGILVGLRRRGGLVRIDVVDTGVGIPADRQAEIFEEFFQLHNPGRDLGEGLGLGLAIVDRLARLLGAQVEVVSKVGRGSRFSLSMPLDTEVCPVAPTPLKPRNASGRVLIVEDNVFVRRGLESTLQQWGYETFAAACGEDALELSAKEAWRFYMIVADYRLGAGLTGIEAAKEIHHRAGRSIPTLVLTGDTARERIAEINSSGFAILHKPVDGEKLRREMVRLLGA
jgi:signal transduction histidine kinase/CheY-like chemotaxis protein